MKRPPMWRRFVPVILVILADLLLLQFRPVAGQAAVAATGEYLLEMLSILPPILLLMGLLDAWVPRSLIQRGVGRESGWIGIALSIFVGSAAAGPLYAAFPVAEMLLRKGARPANVVIFLGTWATIKIPMIMAEVQFLGARFALTRLLLMLPIIIASGFIMERLAEPVLKRHEAA